jgi:DUF4097 and DUF4098 domain-containing protein YvlB
MRRSVLMAAVIAAAALGALPARADQWSKVYKLTGRPDVRVDTNDAAIELTASDANEVSARVIYMGYSAEDIRVRDSQNGNRIEIEARLPSMHWSWGGSSRSVRIELTVPRNANLDLHSADGHIHASGVNGEIKIESGDGHLEASDLKGRIRLHTSDGHIEAYGLDGSVDASTQDGRVRIRGRFDDLRLQTGDGSVTAEVLPGSKMNGNWSIATSDGSISVRLPEGFAADIDAHTGDGSISCQLPMLVSGVLGRKDLRGKLGGGGPTLQIRTGDGSIRLERL